MADGNGRTTYHASPIGLFTRSADGRPDAYPAKVESSSQVAQETTGDDAERYYAATAKLFCLPVIINWVSFLRRRNLRHA